MIKIGGSSVSKYNPEPYDSPIAVFRAAKGVRKIVGDSALGWSGLVQDGLEVHDVPGDHLTMFLEPNVKVVAQTLRRCMERQPNNVTMR